MVATPCEVGDPLRLGRWRVLRRLAVGSGTVVYEVTDGRVATAALKTAAPGGSSKAIARRLHHEATALRRAGVQGVVRLREDGSEALQPYLALDVANGPTIRELVARRGPLGAPQVAVLGALLADVVGRVHRRGVIHGDLKPANVVCEDAGPLLVDFDAAHLFEPPGSALVRPAVGPPEDASMDTVEMTVRVTPAWLAPEQAQGRAVGPAADVFGLGALLAFLATGRSPFGSGRSDELLYRVVHEPADLSGVPVGLQPTLAACLGKDPASRPTAHQLARALLPERAHLAA